MIIEFVGEDICNWIVSYWIENCNDKLILIMIGCIYDYGICWGNCLWLSCDILVCNCVDKWMSRNLGCLWLWNLYEKIVYDWDEIYWFVIVWINGCWWILVVYDYGIYWGNCLWLSWNILNCNCTDKWMLMNLSCIRLWNFDEDMYWWLSCEVLN
jgi:hypothetical protein